MALPPSLAGADQARSIWSGAEAVALRPAGASGGAASVVAWATLEAVPVPAVLIAETW